MIIGYRTFVKVQSLIQRTDCPKEQVNESLNSNTPIPPEPEWRTYIVQRRVLGTVLPNWPHE